MTLTVSTAEAIRDLISSDAMLREELNSISSLQEFTSKLSAAAKAKGIAVDDSALGQALEASLKLQLSPNAELSEEELSEEQLEAVTGGLALTAGTILAIGGAVAIGGGALVGMGGAIGLGGKVLEPVLNKIYGGQ